MIILASASPRRHELLRAAGIEHVVCPATVSEILRDGELPADFVLRLAEEKARAVQARLERAGTQAVLGADTIVCLGDEVFGKPKGEEDARRMLRALSGREHAVHTGICLLRGAERLTEVATTRVCFAQLTESEIKEYTRSGEPFDKAGGYAIQGLASKFVVSISGSYANVVGLPVALVYNHLKAWSLA